MGIAALRSQRGIGVGIRRCMRISDGVVTDCERRVVKGRKKPCWKEVVFGMGCGVGV